MLCGKNNWYLIHERTVFFKNLKIFGGESISLLIERTKSSKPNNFITILFPAPCYLKLKEISL